MKRDHRGLVTTRTPRASSSIRRSSASGRANSLEAHPVELCRYPNKRCWSARALKENGELHSFCEWHRNCANQYQRRLEQRRRNKKLNITTSSAAGAAGSASSSIELTPAPNMCMAGIQSVAEATSRAIADKEALSGSRSAAALSTQEPIGVPAIVTGAMSTAILVTGPLPPVAAIADEYEPFRSPVALQIEDLQYLSLCFPESGPET